MSSCYGEFLKISVFGQSHSAALGVVLDGLPAGLRLDEEKLAAFLARRAPGNSSLSTARREADRVEFLCGLADGYTCGAPLCAVIRNENARPGDYAALADTPRPGHADYTAQVKYGGFQDKSGGGHFSGRLTAALCIAGGVCRQLLEQRGVSIGAHMERAAGIADRRFDPVEVCAEDFAKILKNDLPVLDAAAGAAMADAIGRARAAGDSVGGVVECAVTGLPAGLGEPMFGGLENRIAQAVFAIPAVKGVEFGSGFAGAELRGSENNDPFFSENGAVRTATNNHGGILGGLSSGMPLVFRAAVKPTPSIAMTQQTVRLSDGAPAELAIRGRHDPCIVPRAVPCVEAAAALAVADAWLAETGKRGRV